MVRLAFVGALSTAGFSRRPGERKIAALTSIETPMRFAIVCLILSRPY